MPNDIVLISISRDEIQSWIRDAVKAELSSKSQKKLLASKELCNLLDISLSTLNNWKSSGKIPYKRLGKRIFYELDAVTSAMVDSGYTKLNELKKLGARG